VSWGRVLTFNDPFPYQAAFRAADMELFPTAKGEFRAEVTQVVLNQLWMQRFHENLPRVQTGVIRRGRRVFGFLTKANQPYSCGRAFSPGEIHVNNFEVTHHKHGGDLSSATVSLPMEELAASSKAIVGREFPDTSTRQFVRPNPGLMERLLTLHEMVGQMAKTMPDVFGEAEVVRALEHQLIYTLVKCLTEGTVSTMTAGTLRHELIVARFEEFLEANPNTPLYLTEVCAGIGAAERTLRIACEQHVGMGPIRYLTLRRMHLVRRALLKADSSTTVTRIATDHGFWELGRFSVSYRALFGESPSETLRRPSDDRLLRLNRPSSLGNPILHH
jgi:AraC-like DNA-binding protein